MKVNNIAVIVDGPTEEMALKSMFYKKYSAVPIIRYGPGNGNQYSAETYAKKVIPTLIMLLRGSAYSIILIPDLEKRANKGNATIGKFACDIKKLIMQGILSAQKFKQQEIEQAIFVCPSDIMFENWIISDVEGIKKSGKIKNDIKQECFDGKNGSVLLDNMMVNTKYKKTIHAANLFKYVCIKTGALNSPSFKSVVETFEKLLSTP